MWWLVLVGVLVVLVNSSFSATILLIMSEQMNSKQKAAHQVKKNNEVRNTSEARIFTQTGFGTHKTLTFLWQMKGGKRRELKSQF